MQLTRYCSHSSLYHSSCKNPQRVADMRESREGSRPSLKNHKNIGFLSNSCPDPLINISIQCWVIISTPVKRHLIIWRLTGGL